MADNRSNENSLNDTPETPENVTLSKDIINVLVQLINIAQKRGAYTIEESYLAYKTLRLFIKDPKFDKIEELVQSFSN